MNGYTTVKAFCEQNFRDYSSNTIESLDRVIENRGKDYILNVEEEEFINYLVRQYSFEQLEIGQMLPLDEPSVTKEMRNDNFRGRNYEVEVYNFTITYPFTGSPELFHFRPSTFNMTTCDLHINTVRSTVSFSFKLFEQNDIQFRNALNDCYGKAFSNLQNTNNESKNWNTSLPNYVRAAFKRIKEKYQKENKFFEAINVSVNKDSDSLFSVPAVKKKIIPQAPTADKKSFSSVPHISQEIYLDILSTILQVGKSMEKKPSTYQGKDEEALRDSILLFLETRYNGATGSAEAFNKEGKTDILIKYQDGTNLFIAECKIWHGASEFQKAISQLFDRYITWRDTKAALIVFVRNAEFTKIVNTIKEQVVKHPYFLKQLTARDESSFAFEFHLPDDKDRVVFFEVMAFHFK